MNNCDCNQGRLPCTCKPVPPAGDVEAEPEVVAFLCNAGTVLMMAKQKKEAIWNAGHPLIELQDHRDHVTRLTAERDGLLAEVESYKQGFWGRMAARNQVALRKSDAELTKAREFLVHIKKCLVRNQEYAPLSHQELDGLIGHSPAASCRNECGCLWCHQSAPAAKGGE